VPGAGRRLWAPLFLKHVERQSCAFRQLMTPWRFATERPSPETRLSGIGRTGSRNRATAPDGIKGRLERFD